MGLVERDACLLDGGVELPVNGVAADSSVRDVLAPCEVEVGAGLLRLLPDEAEQGAPALGAGGVEGLRLVRDGADAGLAAGAVDDGLAGEHLSHIRRPDAPRALMASPASRMAAQMSTSSTAFSCFCKVLWYSRLLTFGMMVFLLSYT